MSETLIASLQKRIDELTQEKATLAAEAKDRRLKGRALKEENERFAAALGTELSAVIADASHFLQEDAGPEIGQRIAQWLASGP